MNVYLSVHNNPVNHVDPLGLDTLKSKQTKLEIKPVSIWGQIWNAITSPIETAKSIGRGISSAPRIAKAVYQGGNGIDPNLTQKVREFAGAAEVGASIVVPGVGEALDVRSINDPDILNYDCLSSVLNSSLERGELLMCQPSLSRRPY